MLVNTAVLRMPRQQKKHPLPPALPLALVGVSHKIFPQFPAPIALTVGSHSLTATVVLNGRCVIVVMARECFDERSHL